MAAKKKSSAKKTTKKAVKKSVAKKTKASPKAKAKPKKTAKKATATKKTTVKRPTKISKPYTKSELYADLAERTDVPKKDVVKIFDEFTDIIAAHLKKGAAEKFTLPGILKMTVKKVPAKKARKGINPFTGEETMFKAKPASKKVKVLPLKKLKEMAN